MKKRFKITNARQVSKSIDAAYLNLINTAAVEKGYNKKYYLNVKVCKDCRIDEIGIMAQSSCCKINNYK